MVTKRPNVSKGFMVIHIAWQTPNTILHATTALASNERQLEVLNTTLRFGHWHVYLSQQPHSVIMTKNIRICRNCGVVFDLERRKDKDCPVCHDGEYLAFG